MVGADVELAVDAEGEFGETGRGPVFDRLPNSRLIHVHIAGYFLNPLFGSTVTVARWLMKS